MTWIGVTCWPEQYSNGRLPFTSLSVHRRRSNHAFELLGQGQYFGYLGKVIMLLGIGMSLLPTIERRYSRAARAQRESLQYRRLSAEWASLTAIPVLILARPCAIGLQPSTERPQPCVVPLWVKTSAPVKAEGAWAEGSR